MLFAAMILSLAGCQEAPPTPTEQLQSLGWLTGHWRGSVGKNVFETVYTSPEGGVIVSASKEISKEKGAFLFELEHFSVRRGKVSMTPFPFGRQRRPFTLTALDPAARKATFEDPENDFPQRITYHRAKENRLRITLEGEERKIVYDLARQTPKPVTPR